VTVLIKTFERPDCLRRLVASIRRFYPRIPILVVDDSREPLDLVREGVTRYLHEPYNSLSSGRNFGLRHVETPYVLVIDDDMVFGRKTDIGRMLRYA
jgi:glycosyltransferase involved in cell wall biosynthesis